MIETKPKSIYNIGITIIVISLFIIMSNVGSVLISIILKKELSKIKNSSFMVDHHLEVCSTLITIGIILLIGGIFFKKYKLWANRLVMIITCVFIIMVWAFFYLLVNTLNKENAAAFLVVFCIILTVMFTIPLVLFIRFLNLKRIKQHFN